VAEVKHLVCINREYCVRLYRWKDGSWECYCLVTYGAENATVW